MRAAPLAVISFVISVGAAVGVHAGPADLDPSFATGGSLIVPFAGGNSAAEAVVLQPDGKIVAAGGAGADFALARCDANGALDPSFGAGGLVTTDFTGGLEAAHALVLQQDGMLVAAGSSNPAAIVLARYQTNGTLDPGFGFGGRVVTPGVSGRALVLQPDGMLVVGGYGVSGFMLVRYDAAGVLDATFGTAGVASTDFPDSSGSALLLFGLALQPDGKLVAVGGGGAVIALARFDADGTLDATFGTGGHVTTDVHLGGSGPSARAYAALVQPDGKLALAGVTTTVADTGDGFPVTVGVALVLRYDADGALDTTFNSTGIVRIAGGSLFGGVQEARALIIQPDDELLAVGTSYLRKRITTDGTIDSSFSSNQDLDGSAYALLIQPDMKLVAAGFSPTGSQSTFEIVRFGAGDCGDGVVDPFELCDDGNLISGDGCDANCTPTGCGNNIVTAGEDCEPGLSYCCTASCAFENAGTPCASNGNVCANHACDDAGTCQHLATPSATCAAPPAKKSVLQITHPSSPTKRSVTWTWKRGPVHVADFDDPTQTLYALCVYDDSAGSPMLEENIPLPTCSTCWTSNAKGWKYKDNTGSPYGGAQSATLRSTANASGSLKVKAKGPDLFILPLPMSVDPKVTVQLRNAAGDCWGADFSVPTENDADRFKAKSD